MTYTLPELRHWLFDSAEMKGKFQNNCGAAMAVHSWSLVGFLWCVCPMIKRGGSFLSASPVRDYTAGFLCDTNTAQSSITTATTGLKKQIFLSAFLWVP